MQDYLQPIWFGDLKKESRRRERNENNNDNRRETIECGGSLKVAKWEKKVVIALQDLLLHHLSDLLLDTETPNQKRWRNRGGSS
jgi:hypothetical protein